MAKFNPLFPTARSLLQSNGYKESIVSNAHIGFFNVNLVSNAHIAFFNADLKMVNRNYIVRRCLFPLVRFHSTSHLGIGIGFTIAIYNATILVHFTFAATIFVHVTFSNFFLAI